MSLREQQAGSYHFKRDPEENARLLESVMSTSCIKCGATFNGTAKDCFDWATEHRAHAHPELRDRGQSVRRAAAKAAPISYWTSRTEWGER